MFLLQAFDMPATGLMSVDAYIALRQSVCGKKCARIATSVYEETMRKKEGKNYIL